MNELGAAGGTAGQVPALLRAAGLSCGSDMAGTSLRCRACDVGETGTPTIRTRSQPALTNLLDQIDAATRQQMIVQHLRMVVSIAKHHTGRGLDMVELVRVGNQGLLHAMERFEPEGGFCFTTLLTWCVSRQIELAIVRREREGGAVRGTTPGATFGAGSPT